jgi:hypothetical protein
MYSINMRRIRLINYIFQLNLKNREDVKANEAEKLKNMKDKCF